MSSQQTPILYAGSEADIHNIVEILKYRHYQPANQQVIQPVVFATELPMPIVAEFGVNIGSDVEQLTIQRAVDDFIETQNVHTKQQLDDWCNDRGRGRKPLYAYVKKKASNHWSSIGNPRAIVRGYSQTQLPGYKRYKQ
jgi:hypothetical protein